MPNSHPAEDAILEMRKFIEECNREKEQLKKERNPKLRELIERLDKTLLKEERDDEAIQEMKNFIEECDKAQDELNKKQEHRLTEFIERLDNFKNKGLKTIYGQAAREVLKC